MTPKQLTELDRKIAVMEASKTKEIQCKTRIGWLDLETGNISWNWAACDYRVKPAKRHSKRGGRRV